MELAGGGMPIVPGARRTYLVAAAATPPKGWHSPRSRGLAGAPYRGRPRWACCAAAPRLRAGSSPSAAPFRLNVVSPDARRRPARLGGRSVVAFREGSASDICGQERRGRRSLDVALRFWSGIQKGVCDARRDRGEMLHRRRPGKLNNPRCGFNVGGAAWREEGRLKVNGGGGKARGLVSPARGRAPFNRRQ